jgi:hypothetical protein
MKLVRVGLFAAALALAASCSFAQKAVGYDISGCSPEGFLAAHVDYLAKTSVTITEISPGPDKVTVLETPVVYKFSVEDKDGEHYVSHDFEIVVAKADKTDIIGKLTRDGSVIAIMFGIPADGKTLADNAKKEFGVCQELIAPPEDPSINKT